MSKVVSRIGFIGLGRMGKPMASNLQRKGFDLIVFDINKAPMQELADLGAKAATSVHELASVADIIFTVLPTHNEVAEVLTAPGTSVIAAASSGTLVIDMSTIDPLETDRMASQLDAAGMRLIDCPIGRLASHADSGESLFMVGGTDEDYQKVKPMLEAMGTSIHHCGPVGSGIRTKLVNNFLAIVSCQMNAEALALTQRFGLDLEQTLEVIHGTTATNGQLKLNYATKVLNGDTEPGFQIDLAHKDLSLVLQAGNAQHVPLPIGAAARESISQARASGWGDKDFSALVDALCENTGIDKPRFNNDA